MDHPLYNSIFGRQGIHLVLSDHEDMLAILIMAIQVFDVLPKTGTGENVGVGCHKVFMGC